MEKVKEILVGQLEQLAEASTPANINDPFITLAEENLELLCRDCHGVEHATDLPTDRALAFDEHGNLVERIAKM